MFVILTQTLKASSWTVESITSFVGANTKLELKLHDLSDLVNRIQTQDEKMQSYVSNYHDLERFTLEGFAHWIIAQDTMSVQGLLERIHQLVTGSMDFEHIGGVGVLQLLADNMEVIAERALFSHLLIFVLIWEVNNRYHRTHVYRLKNKIIACRQHTTVHIFENKN